MEESSVIPGHAVIPKYYYVPADFVEAEQNKHGSQKRFPSNSGRDGLIFLWGQALYNIAKLLGMYVCLNPNVWFKNKYMFNTSYKPLEGFFIFRSLAYTIKKCCFYEIIPTVWVTR